MLNKKPKVTKAALKGIGPVIFNFDPYLLPLSVKNIIHHGLVVFYNDEPDYKRIFSVVDKIHNTDRLLTVTLSEDNDYVFKMVERRVHLFEENEVPAYPVNIRKALMGKLTSYIPRKN